MVARDSGNGDVGTWSAGSGDTQVFASGDTAKRDDYYVTLPGQPFPITSLRLEALPDKRLPKGGPGSTYYEGTLGDFYLTEITATAEGERFPFRRGRLPPRRYESARFVSSDAQNSGGRPVETRMFASA